MNIFEKLLEISNGVKPANCAKSITNLDNCQTKKTAKSANQYSDLANLAGNINSQKYIAEFNQLFIYLVKRQGWNAEDQATWLSDLQSEPENTMVCLRALRRSWDAGKYGVLDSLEGVE